MGWGKWAVEKFLLLTYMIPVLDLLERASCHGLRVQTVHLRSYRLGIEVR